MRALVCRELSEDFSRTRLEEVPTPVPGPGEVRVRIGAASLNFPDLLMLKGLYQHKPDLPFIPGMDFAGTVDALGEGVTGLSLGQRVAGGTRSGAFADYLTAPARSLEPVPAAMSLAQAASYPAAYSTAYVSLVCRARVEPGESVLVHGASGGVGMAALDVGRILGARVLATTGSPQKREALLDYGAEAVFSAPGFRDGVRDLTGGEGVQVIYDPVGGDVFDESVRTIAFDGRLLVVGFAGGRIAEVRTNLPLIKAFSIMGVRAGEYGRKFPEKGRLVRETIWKWAAEGLTRPAVFAELSLDRWEEAFALMRDRGLVGKVVLVP
jgi:NADPH2:quinone reductase